MAVDSSIYSCGPCRSHAALSPVSDRASESAADRHSVLLALDPDRFVLSCERRQSHMWMVRSVSSGAYLSEASRVVLKVREEKRIASHRQPVLNGFDRRSATANPVRQASAIRRPVRLLRKSFAGSSPPLAK